jgi:hypothetical protein
MIAPGEKRIFTGVRPARIAVFVRTDDPHWQATCIRIIEFFSATWGGGYNIIVPTDGKTIEEPFWSLLDVYDPDYLYLYYYSGDDLRINEPENYERWVDKHLEQYIAGGPVSDREAARRDIDEQLRNSSVFPGPESDLQQKLIKALAPFHIGQHAFEKSVGVGSSPSFPLAPLVKLLPNIEYPNRLVTYEPADQGVHALWTASITGSVTDQLNRDLDSLGIQHETIGINEYGLLDLFIRVPDDLARRFQPEGVTPFDLASIDTGLYQSVKATAEPGAIVLVGGDTLADFCLYYSLSRLRHAVSWLPMNFLTSQTMPNTQQVLLDGYADELRRAARHRHRQRDPQYVVISASATPVELNTMVQALDGAGHLRLRGIQNTTVIAPDLKLLLQYPVRLYERDNVYRPSSLTVSENSQLDFFDTPRPKNLARLDPYENRWIAEINIYGNKLPRNARLGDWIIRHGMLTTNGARVSKSGLAYFCPNAAYAGGDIDTSLVRPSIFVPTAQQIFEHLFELEAYEARVSDKGFFARDVIEKFGTLGTLATLLRTTPIREMLLKFLDHVKPAEGVRDEGAVLNDKRRYLNLIAISKFLGNDVAAQSTIEVLVAAHVLERGFIFKCKFCRNADWFSMEEVSQSFKCKRCGRSQGISATNYWYGQFEPGWFYKLDEISYQFLRHNGFVTLLALDHLKQRAEESFLYTTDMELTKRGAASPNMELDILCIRDGVMMLGEAKKEDRLGTTKRQEIEIIRRYKRVADQIDAEALVFATLADKWSDNTQKNIHEIVEGFQTILLTKTELLPN